MADTSEARADSRAVVRTTEPTTAERATDFAYAPGAPVAGNPVLFEVEDPADDREYEWTFGDGTTATGEQASNVYDAGGHRTVTLTASGDGATETVERSLTVYREAGVEVGEEQDGLVPVTIRAAEFDAADRLAVESLRFGAPTALAMGGGATPVRSEAHEGNLRIWVPADESGVGGDSVVGGDAPGRLAGRTTDGTPVAGTADGE